MIKFQHIHSADQWEWKVTKGASAGDVGLLETMRADYFGNRLTYACVNQSEFVCITAVAEDGAIPAGTIIGVKGSLSELRRAGERTIFGRFRERRLPFFPHLAQRKR